jgi:hypothetical protein
MSDNNEFIINQKFSVRDSPISIGQCGSTWTNFNIKIYKNGNIDIKYNGVSSCSGHVDTHYPINDLLIISDNKKISEYFINILKYLLIDRKFYRNEKYSEYYYMVVEIIKNYKTNNDEKIIHENKQFKLDKLILENQQKIDYYKSLEQQIIDVNKEKKKIPIDWKNKQIELGKLVLENQHKINYYASIEQQIIDVNKEKELVKEEKRKIAIVKQKKKRI